MTQWGNLLDTVIDTINSTILRGWSYRYTKQELLIMHTTSKRRNIVALAPVVGETPHFWFVKLSVLLHFFFWTLHLLLHPSHVMFENPPKKTSWMSSSAPLSLDRQPSQTTQQESQRCTTGWHAWAADAGGNGKNSVCRLFVSRRMMNWDFILWWFI